MMPAWLSKLLVSLILTAACGAAVAAPPPAEAFFGEPEFTGAALSPSAKFVAVRFAPPGERQVLAVVTLSDMSVKIVASFNNVDIDNFNWVNDDRLVYNATDYKSAGSDVSRRWGLWTVNRDGRESRQLVLTGESHHVGTVQPWNTILVGLGYPKHPDDVYVARFGIMDSRIDTLKLYRLDTVSGKSRLIPGPRAVRYWTIGSPGGFVAHTHEGTSEQLHYRASDDTPWRELARFDLLEAPSFTTAIAADGSLYVSAPNGQDKSSLYQLDPATGKLAATPLFSAGDFDVFGALIQTDRLLGVRYAGDAIRTHWFDEKMKKIQARVDGALRSTVNSIDVARQPETPWVLVQSQSATHPMNYRAFNSETGVLAEIGAMYPRIEPDRMSPTRLIRYKARDGLEIPAWLTVPRSSAGKDLPLVVLVHDGPFRRGGSLDWDARVQFLASRGYAVLMPEYRGSTGFGAAHYRAGWKQWGLKMQDDLTDGARWAVAQGIVNSGRICIAGNGYGGYAALMGVAKDGDIFKCAISLGAMTDLRRLFADNWTQTDTTIAEVNRYPREKLIGDPSADAARLDATSPLALAAKITRPVLLAHGDADHWVPIRHSKKFKASMASANLEWVEYEGETHVLTLAKNRIDFWTRVEAFLKKHIGR